MGGGKKKSQLIRIIVIGTIETTLMPEPESHASDDPGLYNTQPYQRQNLVLWHTPGT